MNFLDGLPLFLTACALTALTYATQSYWPVLGLLVLMALTIPCGTYGSKSRTLGAVPTRDLRERQER